MMHMDSITIGRHTYRGITVNVGRYADGTLAVTLDQPAIGERVATPTICLAGYGLAPSEGCVFLPSYAEHLAVTEAVLGAGLFALTGRTVRFGPFDTSAVEAQPLFPTD